ERGPVFIVPAAAVTNVVGRRLQLRVRHAPSIGWLRAGVLLVISVLSTGRVPVLAEAEHIHAAQRIRPVCVEVVTARDSPWIALQLTAEMRVVVAKAVVMQPQGGIPIVTRETQVEFEVRRGAHGRRSERRDVRAPHLFTRVVLEQAGRAYLIREYEQPPA